MSELHSVKAPDAPAVYQDEAPVPVLSAEQVRVLNEARKILQTLEHDRLYVHPRDFRDGMLSNAADTAVGAVFDVLNIANVYFGVEVPS